MLLECVLSFINVNRLRGPSCILGEDSSFGLFRGKAEFRSVITLANDRIDRCLCNTRNLALRSPLELRIAITVAVHAGNFDLILISIRQLFLCCQGSVLTFIGFLAQKLHLLLLILDDVLTVFPFRCNRSFLRDSRFEFLDFYFK